MARGSKGRGNRGELEVVHLLRRIGFTAHRGQQYEGSSDSPDVVCEEIADRCHLEVKCVEGFLSKKMKDAYVKADSECALLQTPVIVHRYLKRKGQTRDEMKLAKRWLVTVDAGFFFHLLRKLF